jgi:hypothetical protein
VTGGNHPLRERAAYHHAMSTDDRDDPGADTAMFRAYVEEGNEPAASPPAANRTVIIAVAVAVAVVVLLVVILAAS